MADTASEPPPPPPPPPTSRGGICDTDQWSEIYKKFEGEISTTGLEAGCRKLRDLKIIPTVTLIDSLEESEVQITMIQLSFTDDRCSVFKGL